PIDRPRLLCDNGAGGDAVALDLSVQPSTRVDHHSSLRRIARAIASRHPLSDTLNLITSEARTLTRASVAALGLRADSGAMLDFVAVAGSTAREMFGLRIRVSDYQAEYAMRTGQHTILGDTYPMNASSVT